MPKLILDTTVESKNPDKNNAFGAVAFLGNSQEYGEQWLYSRFNVMQFTDLNYYIVESANLYARRFSNTKVDVKAYKMSMPWCSFGSTWNTKTNYAELLSQARILNNYKVIDLTSISLSPRGTSFSLSLGTATSLIPFLLAPYIFSNIPPTGLTFPLKEISPVIATS